MFADRLIENQNYNRAIEILHESDNKNEEITSRKSRFTVVEDGDLTKKAKATINELSYQLDNDFKDIIEQKNTKQHIFRKQILNDNLFGKLTIFPTGEVYSNVNFPTIGNIQDQKLSEIVYSEIENYFKPWFFTRDYVSCKNCVNKYLCPSISNYEIVANEYNMCYLNQ